jgi:hypothetical protein
MWWTRQDEIEFQINRNKEDLRVNRFSAYSDPYNPQKEQDNWGRRAMNYAKGVAGGVIVGGALGAVAGRFGGAGNVLAKEGKAITETFNKQKQLQSDIRSSFRKGRAEDKAFNQKKAELTAQKDKLPSTRAEANQNEIHGGKTKSDIDDQIAKLQQKHHGGSGTRAESEKYLVKTGQDNVNKMRLIRERKSVIDEGYKTHMTPYVGGGAAIGGVVGVGAGAMIDSSDNAKRRRQGYSYSEPFARVNRYNQAVNCKLALIDR